jgi:signal transduction histidine kinase
MAADTSHLERRSRLTRKPGETISLDRIVESVISESAAAAEAAKLSINLTMQRTDVRGDAVLLTHLVRNLLSNAIRYNQPGGQVNVHLQPGLLHVTNTGPVVPATAVPHLFEPFRRVQPRHHAPGEGAGLGLSIAVSIARGHDATISARANPGGGLTVNVDFPAP